MPSIMGGPHGTVNAVSTETVFHTDVTDIPLLLRGQPTSSTGADVPPRNSIDIIWEYGIFFEY